MLPPDGGARGCIGTSSGVTGESFTHGRTAAGPGERRAAPAVPEVLEDRAYQQLQRQGSDLAKNVAGLEGLPLAWT